MATINCLTVDILEPVRGSVEENNLDESTKDVLGTPKESKLIEQILKASKDDEVSEKEKEDLKQMLHLCKLVESESQERSRETIVNS